MKYNAPRDAMILRRASLGPAAMADRSRSFQEINQGLPQKRFVDANMMIRGGSVGNVGQMQLRGTPLGCCGLGGLGSLAVDNRVIIGPIAARMILLRKQGMLPKLAMLDALANLARQGHEIVTPEIHLQLAAGLQPFAGGLSGLLGSLGFAPIVSSGIAAASTTAVAASLIGTTALTAGAAAIGLTTAATGIGAGILLGQATIPIPLVGAVIGAIVFEAAQLMKRHVGKAEAAWANQGFYNSLKVTQGRDYEEKQYSEAFKGMMDTGNNIVPGCGADRHKNPDCILGPMAGVIAHAYLTQQVPLSATSMQVFITAVKPWLASGAGGLVNWNNLAQEPIQLSMMAAATDRYLAGEAMTRGDMPAYAGQGGAHTPTLVQALQPILQQPSSRTPQMPNVIAPGAIPAAPSYNYPAGGVPGLNPGSGGNNLTWQPIGPPPSMQVLPAYPGMRAPSGGGGPTWQPGSPTSGAPYQPAAPGGLAAMIPWGLVIAAGAAILS